MFYSWCSVVIAILLAFFWHGVTSVEIWKNVTCPAKCRCEIRTTSRFGGELRTVDCDNRKLEAIPNLPPDTEVLLLRRNVITSIAGALNDLTDLKEVDLSSNIITGKKVFVSK